MSDWQPLGRQSLLAARSTRAAGQTEEPCAPGRTLDCPSPPAVPRSAPRVGPALFMEPLRGSNPPGRFSCDGVPSQSAVVSPFNLAEPRRWLFSSTSLTNRYFLPRAFALTFPERNRERNVTETSRA